MVNQSFPRYSATMSRCVATKAPPGFRMDKGRRCLRHLDTEVRRQSGVSHQAQQEIQRGKIRMGCGCRQSSIFQRCLLVWRPALPAAAPFAWPYNLEAKRPAPAADGPSIKPPSRRRLPHAATARQSAVPATHGRQIDCRHRNLLVTGPCGVGKSWLSCALAQKACRDGYTVLYARVPRLFADLELAHGDGRFTRLFRTLVKAHIQSTNQSLCAGSPTSRSRRAFCSRPRWPFKRARDRRRRLALRL